MLSSSTLVYSTDWREDDTKSITGGSAILKQHVNNVLRYIIIMVLHKLCRQSSDSVSVSSLTFVTVSKKTPRREKTYDDDIELAFKQLLDRRRGDSHSPYIGSCRSGSRDWSR